MATTALYNYFPSKDDLLDAAIDAAAGEIRLPEPSAQAWKEQLTSVARAWFRQACGIPGWPGSASTARCRAAAPCG